MIKRRSLLKAMFLGAAVAFTQPRLVVADGPGFERGDSGLFVPEIWAREVVRQYEDAATLKRLTE